MALMSAGPKATAAATSTVERRVADVAVLGSSGVALAAAYSLVRRGKKVVLIPDLGLTAPRPPSEVYHPLHLTHPEGAMVSLASEAAAYWRGLQAQASGTGRGAQLLKECRSLDLAVVRGAGPAGEMLSRMQEACKAAGVRLGSLRAEELGALFPAMRLPAGVSGLLQPEGGVLHSAAIHSVLLNMCERQGVLVRDRLILRGWRDAGSHFVLRASGSLLPSAVSLFEVEQVLVAPEGWPHHVLRMFGADAALQVAQSCYARCAATSDLTGLPLWRSIGVPAAGLMGGSDPSQDLQIVTGFPARLANDGSSDVAFKLALGLLPPAGAAAGAITDPWGWRHGAPDRSGLAAAHRLSGQLLRGVGPLLLPPDRQQAAMQSEQWGEQWGDVALHATSSDGWPVVGFVPGLEAGRMLFATTTSGSFAAEPAVSEASKASDGSGRGGGDDTADRQGMAQEHAQSAAEQGSARGGNSSGAGAPAEAAPAPAGQFLGGRRVLSDGYQLSPLLAKMAVDLLCGAARAQEADPEHVDLARSSMAACARVEGLDSWNDLERWQSGEAFRPAGSDDPEALERADAIARGAPMLGADARDEVDRELEERRRGQDPNVGPSR